MMSIQTDAQSMTKEWLIAVSPSSDVIAFIFADLIVLPILDIYRKYYGLRMTGFILASLSAGP